VNGKMKHRYSRTPDSREAVGSNPFASVVLNGSMKNDIGLSLLSLLSTKKLTRLRFALEALNDLNHQGHNYSDIAELRKVRCFSYLTDVKSSSPVGCRSVERPNDSKQICPGQTSGRAYLRGKSWETLWT
jgi:hypothetical protein